jgi:magnesium-transporting ATPase (P-type)
MMEIPYYLTLFIDLSNIMSSFRINSNRIPKNSSQRKLLESPKSRTKPPFRSLRNRFSTMFSIGKNKKLLTTPFGVPLATTYRESGSSSRTEVYKEDGLELDSRREGEGCNFKISPNQTKITVRSLSRHSVSPPPRLFSDLEEAKLYEAYAFNLDSLSVLGNVGEVVISKTDLLTFGNFSLKQLATLSRNYSLGDSDFLTEMAQYRSNPELFNQEDDEEYDPLEENSHYNEKLQEFHKELEGKYDAMLMESDEELDPKLAMEQISYPHYLNKKSTNLLFQVEDKQVSEVIEPEGTKHEISKLEDLSSFYNLLKQPKYRTPTPHKNTERNKPKEIGEKLHKVLDQKKVQEINGKKEAQKDKKRNRSAHSNHLNTPSKSNSKETSPLPTVGNYLHRKSIEEKVFEDISINFTREHGVKSLISDLASRKHYLDDLMNYLYLLQECSSISKRKHLSHTSSLEMRDSLKEIFTEFGYELRLTSKRRPSEVVFEKDSLTPSCLHFNAKIETGYGVVSNFQVKIVNEFSNIRKRLSLIVADKEKSTETNLLLVQGEEKHMRHCLKLNKQNKNLYKFLASRYKSQGYRAIVIGIRVLDKEETQEYINNFISLLKTSRDQIQNLEKLALSIEKELHFFGMLGVIDEVRPEAVNFCNSIKSSGIGMHLFTGDTLDRCLYIVKQLNFSDIDFSKSGEFFHFNFKTVPRGISEMMRVFEIVYQSLKAVDNNEKFLLKMESIKKYSDTLKNKMISWMQEKSRTYLETSVEKILDLSEIIPKKPLLLSGQAISVFMKSPSMVLCLQAIAGLSSTIIVYSAQPAHFSFLVKVLKKKSFSSVLAIGDGFNQFGIFREADVSIQIQHPDVPLIFGDLMVNNLKGCHDLLFVKSFSIFKRNMIIILIEFWRVLPYSFLMMFYLFTSGYSGYMANRFHIWTFYLSGCIQILIFSLIDISSRKRLGHLMPNFYLENKNLENSSTKIFIIILIWSFIETIYLGLLLIFFVCQEIASNGYTLFAIEVLQNFIFLGNLTIGAFKISFMASRSLALPSAVSVFMIGIAMLILFWYEDWRANTYIIRSYPVFAIFKSTRLSTYFTFYILVPIYGSLCLSMYLKIHYFSPFSKVFSKAYQNQDSLKEFKKDVEALKKKLTIKLFHFRLEDQISKIKQIFAKKKDFHFVEKIASIDTFTNRSGISLFTNRIIEKGEAARFMISQINGDRYSARYLLGIVIGLTIIMWVIYLINESNACFNLDMFLPWTILLLFIPFSALFVKKAHRFVYSVLKYSVILIIIVTMLFTFVGDNAWTNARFALSRLVFSNYPLDYPVAVFLGTAIDMFMFAE